MTKEKRQKTIKVRVTQSEFDEIEKKKGVYSTSNFMRNMALNNELAEQQNIKLVDPNLIRNIASIGNLLNQIARVANIHAKAGYPIELAKLNIQIKSIENLLSEVVSNAS
ncbi:plasmid mobilization protein [Vibrio cholerae]